MPPLLPGNQGTSSSRHIGAVITLEATELCNPGTVSSASRSLPYTGDTGRGTVRVTKSIPGICPLHTSDI